MSSKFTNSELQGVELKNYRDALKISIIDGVKKIWCVVRQKHLVLQPEEMVRQLWVQFLVEEIGLSTKTMAIEKQVKVLGKNRRFDLLCVNADLSPIVLFEFKAFEEKLTNEVFDQISLYNRALKIPYLIISNGHEHYACKIDFEHEKFSFITEMESIFQLQ